MFRPRTNPYKKIAATRTRVVAIILSVILVVFGFRAIQLQIFDAEKYQAQRSFAILQTP